MSDPVPPGWPVDVRPPGAPDWEQSASAWLFDQCPPDYRGYAVLRRHPVALARLAARHVEGSRRTTTEALAGIRSDLSGSLDARTLAQLIDVLEAEQARLLATGRAVALVEHSLRGLRHVPRL